MNIETLINAQYELGQKIEQVVANCKKAGKPRRTGQFLTNKITELQALTEQFHKAHGELERHEEKDAKDEYFTTKYYEKIRDLVTQYVKVLETEAIELGTEHAANEKKSALDTTTRKILRNQKALIEVINNNVDDIMANRNISHPQSYYSVKAAILEKHMIDLAKNNVALWEATEDDSIEDYTPRTYYEIESKVEYAIIELQTHLPEGVHHTSTTSTNEQNNNNSQNMLPRISLPKFNGDYMQWAAFKDLFTELVHNASTNDTQRIYYLNNALTDEPKNLIKHLPAIGSNYASAWEILINRYDNKRLLVSTLVNTLLSQPFGKPDSASCLKSLHDVTKECIHGLKAQGLQVQYWDALISHIVLKKMDQESQTAFEQSLDNNKRLITQDEILEFLEKRFQSLEVRGHNQKTSRRTCGSIVNAEGKCSICKKEPHQIYECKEFQKAAAKQKWQFVKDLRLCANCLKPGHQSNACRSQHCTKCTRKHNSLLHPETHTQKDQTNNKTSTNANSNTTSLPISIVQEESQDVETTTAVNLLAKKADNNNYVLLGTARIQIRAENGTLIECRAVLDAGSQVNLITERLSRKLGVTPVQSHLNIEGVGTKETPVRQYTQINVLSKDSKFERTINAHVMKKIVSDQPAYFLRTENWNIPKQLKLADPDFASPGRVDCLIGAEIFFDLLTDGKIKLAEILPTLVNTIFGWIVARRVESSEATNAICGICTKSELETTLSNFFKIEEIPDSVARLSEDDVQCEAHFLHNTTRESDGKFMVRYPVKEHTSLLSDTRELAYHRFRAIEKKLSENPELRDQYIAFMREYESLGHMTEVDLNKVKKPRYFIPHHCVIRSESTSTKLRVVFDASARTVSGASLNDIMHTGPTVQDELFSILIRYRSYRFVLKTDVEKMFRMIWINPEDRNLQLIMWRENPTDRLKIYQLKTVTQGTRPAPFLATRSLKKLAQDNMQQFPYGAKALMRNFYVDDGLLGADSYWEAEEIRQQLIKIFNSAGMKLKKWCSNNQKLLNGIPLDDQEVPLTFDTEEGQTTKTLGLLWLPKSDTLGIKSNIQGNIATTKREVTSDLARIYDPLGLVGPVVVTAKIFIQQLWELKYDWDTDLPLDLKTRWTQFRNDLPSIEKTQIPRYIFDTHDKGAIQLHAFADASERAYGAAIYIRTTQKDKSIKVNLLCSKSRVAPLKLQTIPKLELCAALLAAELMSKVKNDLENQDKMTYFWSDSQIVLSWLNHHPGTLTPFVAHRVVKIRQLTTPDQWRHVPSKQNPADILSRGLKPRDLPGCSMWFYGPLFLYQHQQTWPAPYNKIEEAPIVVAVANNEVNRAPCWIYSIPSKNSFWHVQRVVGYVLRFIKNARRPKDSRPEFTTLTIMELDAALKQIVRQIQMSDFNDVKKLLIKEKCLPKSHKMSQYTPFLDEEGIIRVGGRISNSKQKFDSNHQMILPANDPLVRLLVEKIHRERYHCEQKTLVGHIRQRFWPLNVDSIARSVIRRCVTCTKAKAKLYSQIMGNLPAHRVEPARPFLNSGVDYCGPFWVHFKTRGKRPQKAYLAIFCCFSSKAVHLELVTDLTTDAFIGALKRFIARRGHCKTLYCDNATNFKGAKNQLDELLDVIYSKEAQESIITECSKREMDFKFIPPRTPHFGGLWEAAVKSAKTLLLKNVSPASLTYEELETVIVEIEAMLNSRPLIPHPSNPNDLNAITPGHALIGSELTSSVDVHAQPSNQSIGNRWQQVSQVKHQFWKRWRMEYLNELQQRHKWKGPVRNVQLDTLVIIKEDNVPVLQWPLGRVVKVYTGDDGYVRVCDVKTQNGIFKRAIHRLAPLFPEEELKEESTQNTSETLQSKQSQEKELQPQAASLPISIPISKIKNFEALNLEMPPRKRTCLHSGILYATIILLLFPLALCNPINVTEFNKQPGIHFEEMNAVIRVTANWKLVVYYDLGPYREELSLLRDGTTALQKMCENSSSNTTCNLLIQYFEQARDELESKVNLVSGKRRSARGAVDIVGNIAHSLFGVLDSNYENSMSETINELTRNDEHLEKLLKNQTSIVDSTINIMKKNQLSVQAKFEELDSEIHELLYGSGKEKEYNKINVVMPTLAISMLSIQMLALVINLQRTHAMIMDVLIDSHHDKINPLLLTPSQIDEELTKIRAHLPSHLQLPISDNNIMEVYKYIKVNGIIAESHAVFTIELPLADPQKFQLFHLTPIAAIRNESLAEVKLSTTFLAITPQRDEFLPMKQHQLEACISLSHGELLCANIQATYHPASAETHCEFDLLNNLENPRCVLYKIDGTTIWHQLHNPNQWIYGTLNKLQLNAVCDEEPFQVQLQNSGLLQMTPNCIIHNNEITIIGRRQFHSSLQSSANSKSMLGWTKQYTAANISVKHYIPAVKELELIQQQLAHINSSSLPTHAVHTSYHSLAISYTSIGLIVAAIIIALNKRRKSRASLPIAAPRQLADTVC